jgi:NAD-dependent deacetylase
MARTEVERASVLVERAQRIVVLTGAGVSTDSGIPDFRGPDGVWTRDPAAERMATLEAYVGDPEVRRRAWQSRLTSPLWAAQPNRGHEAIVELERTRRLDTLITQNIDGLHQKAGSNPDLIIEIHGNSSEIVCLSCQHRQPAEPVHDRVRAGETDPACQEVRADGAICGGILKSATISFGQNLAARDLQRAEAATTNCDLLLAVGSTLAVYPAAALVPIAAHTGAAVVIVNGGPTDMDTFADVIVTGPIGELLPTIVKGVSARTDAPDQ